MSKPNHIREYSIKIGDEIITVSTNKPVSPQRTKVLLKRLAKAIESI